MAKAELIGVRAPVWGGTEAVYRLSAPLLDCYPEWRNILVQYRADGARCVLRGMAWQDSAGAWRTVPAAAGGSWVACCSPLSARDLAFAEAEIAGALEPAESV